MAVPGIQVTRLRAEVDAEAAAARRLRLAIREGTLRIGERSLSRLLPPGTPVQVEGVTRNRIFLRGSWSGIGFTVEVAPYVSPEGRARLEIVSVRAAGFLPIPEFVIRAILERLARPGIYLRGGRLLDLDLAELLQPLGVTLGPLREVRAEGGVLELRF